MKKIILTVALAIFALSASGIDAEACTSAIISGRLTPDGRPLLWKHRDTKILNNRIDYVKSGNGVKYAFIAVVNSTDKVGQSWMGTNEVGFSIINTASSPMRKYPQDENDQEGYVMYKALGCCKNLADFEKFLKDNQPVGVETNFGVIDAEGGAAYYETNSYEWTKIDVNNPDAAPLGYVVFTNFSPAGKQDAGGGYIRYTTASNTLSHAALRYEKITPRWIFDNLSRSFVHPVLGIDLTKSPELTPEGWFYDMDFIPRNSTSSAAVIQGVKPGENPLLTTMWAVLGYPPAGVAVPVTVAAGADQPAVATRIGKDDPACPLSNAAMERRDNVFPIVRGSGPKYLHFDYLFNAAGTGVMQRIRKVEDAIFDNYEALRQEWCKNGKVNKEALKKYYSETDFGLEIK